MNPDIMLEKFAIPSFGITIMGHSTVPPQKKGGYGIHL